MLNFVSPVPFSTPEDRAKLACILTELVNKHKTTGVPYCPNASDSFFWTIDSGNDWKLKISQEDPAKFAVYHRYDSVFEEKKDALAAKILRRLGVVQTDLSFAY